ncbi:MAG: cyclic pyranopterin monophosphate synthase MoaC [Nitrososphaerota archaeon]|nr:cyclic pyranopterin monophosphate synthase MoaC [Nitrososphaerota archaeon]
MKVKMVDISKKESVYREAIAMGRIHLKPKTIELIKEGKVEKGDPIQIATLAGIQGAKLTPLLMPLCHPIRIDNVDIESEIGESSITITAKVRSTEKTGVEMEALTAVMTALLNVWDVVKMYEKDENGQYPTTFIESVKVVKKVKEGYGGCEEA